MEKQKPRPAQIPEKQPVREQPKEKKIDPREQEQNPAEPEVTPPVSNFSSGDKLIKSL